jgi:two-component system chemotaxis response regulator CheB
VLRNGRLRLTREPERHACRPSVDVLFESIAAELGPAAVCGLLTGMGRDGAEELRLLKEKGAVTFAQDKDSSVVHGMPGEAIRLDAAMLVLPPEKIAAVLTSLARNGHAHWRGS